MLWYLATPLHPSGNETLQSNVELATEFLLALLHSGIKVVAPQLGFCLMVDANKEPRHWNFSAAIALDVLARCDGLILAGYRLSNSMEMARDVATLHALKVMDCIALDVAAVVEAVNVTECLSEMEESTTEVLF